MKTANQEKKATPMSTERLKLHHEMYERRLRLLKEREGLSEKEAGDLANSPSFETEEQPTEA